MPGFEDRPLSYFGVRWELAGGDAAGAALTVSEDGGKASLAPVRAGSTWLFVHADGLGTAIIPVEVKKKALVFCAKAHRTRDTCRAEVFFSVLRAFPRRFSGACAAPETPRQGRFAPAPHFLCV